MHIWSCYIYSNIWHLNALGVVSHLLSDKSGYGSWSHPISKGSYAFWLPAKNALVENSISDWSLISVNRKVPITSASCIEFGCNNFASGESRMALFTDSRHTSETACDPQCDPKICHNFASLTNACAMCILHIHISLVWFNSQKCYAGWAPPNAELSWWFEDTECGKKFHEQANAMKFSRMNARRQLHRTFGENELWFLGHWCVANAYDRQHS